MKIAIYKYRYFWETLESIVISCYDKRTRFLCSPKKYKNI